MSDAIEVFTVTYKMQWQLPLVNQEMGVYDTPAMRHVMEVVVAKEGKLDIALFAFLLFDLCASILSRILFVKNN